LQFVQERKIRRLKIANPDYFYDVLIQRREPTPPAKLVDRPIVDTRAEVPFV
jgi:hypothetical protein